MNWQIRNSLITGFVQSIVSANERRETLSVALTTLVLK